MPNRKMRKRAKPFAEHLAIVSKKLRPPFGVVLGSPAEVTEMVQALPEGEKVCFQMDLYQAQRVTDALKLRDLSATVEAHADLWDMPTELQTLIYPVPYGGERTLKLDMIEQAYHALKPQGAFVVFSPYEKDDFFHKALKKVFGRVHVPMDGSNAVFWCQREEDQPRRRHEMSYHVRVDAETSYSFVSRPGVFGYGFFDEGARALTQAMEISEGQRILDIGCGVGTNGILAARRLGPTGSVVFADSNLRAIALADLNAKALGLANYQCVASHTLTEWPDASFDVVLANPPYYAHGGILRLFIERSKALLKPGGTLFLVTKQVDAASNAFYEQFLAPEMFECRGYVVFRIEMN